MVSVKPFKSKNRDKIDLDALDLFDLFLDLFGPNLFK